MFCPCCNGPVQVTGPCLVLDTIKRTYARDISILTCSRCAAATEILVDRRLLEFPGLDMSSLWSPFPGEEWPRTTASLRGASILYKSES